MILPFILMMMSIIVIDLFKIIYTNQYPVCLSFFGFFYVFGYAYLIFFSKKQLPFKTIIFFFIFLRCYKLFFVIGSGEYELMSIERGSDWERFHIPQAMRMTSYLEHLFAASTTYDGRLTHVLIKFCMNILDYFGYDASSAGNIYVGYNIFNTILGVMTLRIVYLAALKYSNSLPFSSRAVWFLAFSPFFILYTSAPLKESLLFFAFSLFLLYVVDTNKKHWMLLVVLLIVPFERIYLLPVLLAILFFNEKSKRRQFFYILMSFVIVESMIGIDRALSMHSTHVVSLTSIDGSLLPDHGFLSNVIRTLFGPAFFRAFLTEYSSAGALGISRDILYLMFAYIAIKSFFNFKGVLNAVLISYIFVFIFLPFHSTLKIFLLTIFCTLFLNVVSFVKYRNNDSSHTSKLTGFMKSTFKSRV